MPVSRPRGPLVSLVSLVLALPWLVVGAPPAAAAGCSELDTPVLVRSRPASGDLLLTPWRGEADGAAAHGFTDDLGTAFRASLSARPGLVAVHRLSRGGRFDYAVGAAVADAVDAGASDQGPRFYVGTEPGSCLVPVLRYRRDGGQRLVTESVGVGLAAAGWASAGTVFHARPAAAPASSGLVSRPIATTSRGSAFSFAVVPDTQMEVVAARDRRLTQRTEWLVAQKRTAFVLQTGDLVNWDTPDHAQWKRAKAALAPLERARIPYTVAVGNHDTMATGVGGSARDPARSYALQRDTDTLNAYLNPAGFRGVGGVFEPGKVDNVYTLYRAGGLQWMVLTLEFCPRKSAVAWARRVVAAHPDYNVIVSTHFYLTKTGAIGSSDAGYGDTSPKYLWQQLVSQYPNIKLVFSGHVGKARKARVDTGKKGNKVYSFLTTMHDRKTNPTRIVSIDTRTRRLSTRVYASADRRTWSQYTQTLTGLTFVR